MSTNTEIDNWTFKELSVQSHRLVMRWYASLSKVFCVLVAVESDMMNKFRQCPILARDKTTPQKSNNDFATVT